jgi:N-acetylmuramoyl-L-alanine amidase
MPSRTEQFHGAQPTPDRPAFSLPCAARRKISAILFAVRNSRLLLAFLSAVIVAAPPVAAQSASQPGTLQEIVQEQTPPSDLAPQLIPPAPATPTVSSPPPGGPYIVLDPAHGGTDTGARGASGGVEKDIVLRIAQSVRTELERQGYRVMMTRNDDSNPSYDDRAAIANTYHDTIFVTLHVSSTGTPNTVHAYYNQFSTSVPAPPDANSKTLPPSRSDLIAWEEAQRPYLDASHRLADLLQRELAQFFSGSPASSSSASVRGLRSIAAPAVAVEISSVSEPNPDSLTAAAIPVANAIARGVVFFRQSVSSGAK